jgi:hypothetical protein
MAATSEPPARPITVAAPAQKPAPNIGTGHHFSRVTRERVRE